MGAAGSVHEEKDVDKEFESMKKNMPTVDKFNKVDIFAKEMYMNSPKVEALQLILSEELGREAFMKFLRTQYAEENLNFFNVSSLFQNISHHNGILYRSLFLILFECFRMSTP